MAENYGRKCEDLRRACPMPRLSLVILVLLFLASPSLAGEWTKTQDGNCQVWVVDRLLPQDRITWTGTCENGRASGPGFSKWVRDGEVMSVYEGEFKDGKLHGTGVLSAGGSYAYKGEFKNGLRDGQGTEYLASGKSYEGEWRNRELTGNGEMIWPSGIRYVGEFRRGKPNGQGVMTWPDGNVVNGEFVDGEPRK